VSTALAEFPAGASSHVGDTLRPMLTQVRIQNYKLLKDVTLDLGRLAVLVGPNGAGKTSVLEAIAALDGVAKNTPGARTPVVSGVEVIRREEPELAIAAKTSRPDGWLEVRVDRNGPHASSATFDGLRRGGFEIPWQSARKYGLGTALTLRMDPATLRRPSAPATKEPTISSTGEHLAPTLQYLHNLRDGRFEQIEAMLPKIVPAARRVRVVPAEVPTADGTQFGVAVEVEWEGSGWVPAAHLSDGTLIVLGLLTAIHRERSRLVLIEDLDNRLHPAAQEQLLDRLRELLAADPELQVIATTHSPFILDKLDASEVFVVGPSGPGESRVVRLDQHPRWKDQQGFTHPGEFWTWAQEGWVADVTPGSTTP
jgi:predicted ATPase